MPGLTLRTLCRLLLAASLSAVWVPAGAEDRCEGKPPEEFKFQTGTPFDKVKINADEIDFPGRNVVILRGFTQLFRGGHRVSSDELIYYKTKNTAEARGAVTLVTHAGDIVKTNVLAYDIAGGMAVSGPAEFTIANRTNEFLGTGSNTVNAYGTAERVTFESADVMLLEVADVTSCLDGTKDITFHAEKLRVDLNLGVRTGTRVKIRIDNPGKHRKLNELKNLIE